MKNIGEGGRGDSLSGPPSHAPRGASILCVLIRLHILPVTTGAIMSPPMVNSAPNTLRRGASISLARVRTAVPFSRASAKVSQGGVCGGPYEKTGVPLPGLERGRPRQEFAG